MAEGERKPRRWTPKKGHDLTAKERQDMPKSDFAMPGKGEGPKGAGSGSYPIPDKAHARAALSRGAANASPAELAEIKRKVHEKYPDMGKGEHRRLRDVYKSRKG